MVPWVLCTEAAMRRSAFETFVGAGFACRSGGSSCTSPLGPSFGALPPRTPRVRVRNVKVVADAFQSGVLYCVIKECVPLTERRCPASRVAMTMRILHENI